MRISCAPTDHRPVEPTVGFRFDYGGSSVVTAGDTVARAGMDTLVLTHYFPPFAAGAGDEYRAQAAKHFEWVIEVGNDLHRVEI